MAPSLAGVSMFCRTMGLLLLVCTALQLDIESHNPTCPCGYRNKRMSALTGAMTHAGGEAQSDTASTEHISTVACV